MKFIIRRSLAGIVFFPAVAGIYFVGYASLVGFNFASASSSEVAGNSLLVAGVATLALIFWPQLLRQIDKLG